MSWKQLSYPVKLGAIYIETFFVHHTFLQIHLKTHKPVANNIHVCMDALKQM